LQRLWDIIQTFYSGLEPEKRRLMWVGVVVAAIALGIAYSWGSHVPYQTLVSGRSLDELYVAAGALDEAEIAYAIDQDRGTIKVPSSQWGAAGAVVASANVLPSLTDISHMPMGVNPSAQQWAILRQKEGDLARVLQTWSSVHGATISIVPMTETFAFEEPRPASANVALALVPGSNLDKGEVNTITHIVASSVNGLEPDNVTVSDNYGNLLAEGNMGNMDADPNSPSNIFDRKVMLENRLERNVRRSLQGLLGVGNYFTVSSHVDLEMSTTQARIHKVEADKPALISEQIQESDSEKQAAGGAPGVDANLPERQAGSAARSADQKSTESQMVNNYDHPKADEIVYRPAGSVKRISVAVNVSQTQVAAITGASPGEAEWLDYEKKIQSAIRGAVGYDEARNDNVQLQILPFAVVEVAELSEPLMTFASITPLIPHAIAVLALVLAFVFVVKPIMRQMEKPVVKPKWSSGDQLAYRLKQMVSDFEPIDAGDLNSLVANQPDLAAQVIKKWNRNSA
jgi:flagellar M-ring protein FliF